MSAEIDDYRPTAGATRAMVNGGSGTQPGDPAKAAAAVLAALDAPETPLRLPLGDDSVDAITTHLDSVRTEIATWEKTARATAFEA
jgi:hypothetical protein